MSKSILDHSKSFHNLEDIKKSSVCGCFYCEKIFSPDEVKDWVDEEMDEVTGARVQGTALCPYCNMDSVIAEDENNKITPETLKASHDEYFNHVYRPSDIK